MSELYSAEFTGERVIPGLVEDNLFNEHIARYCFAVSLARQFGLTGRFLDAGCGAGYGSAELAKTGAQVMGIDVAPEAVAHARANYPGIRFEQASCTEIPAANSAMQLISAFEVIEHLSDWQEFLREAARVLNPDGLFLVSTPNRLYYAESRKNAGPNPFHVHEFTEDEFRSELESVFPHVKILLQNHVEGIALAGTETQGAAAEISEKRPDPSEAHFFLAVCGKQPLPPIPAFVYLPETGNVLQTRERHIALLNGEVQQKNEWIAHEQQERDAMLEKVRELEAELEEHNRWASAATREAERHGALVLALQQELDKSNDWAQASTAEATERGRRIEQLQEELAHATAWAKASATEATERGRRIEQLQEELAQATEWAKANDAEVTERGRRIEQLQEEVARATAWANSCDAESRSKLNEDYLAMTAGYEAAIEQWRRDKAAADQWAIDTEIRLSAERDDAREAFAAAQAGLEDALRQIASLQNEKSQIEGELAAAHTKMSQIAQSRWVRLGRMLSVGPEIEQRP